MSQFAKITVGAIICLATATFPNVGSGSIALSEWHDERSQTWDLDHESDNLSDVNKEPIQPTNLAFAISIMGTLAGFMILSSQKANTYQ